MYAKQGISLKSCQICRMSKGHSSRPEPWSEQWGTHQEGPCPTRYPRTGCWRSSSWCRRCREVQWAALHHRIFWQTPQVCKQGWKSSANRRLCEIPPASFLLQMGNTARTALRLIICAFSPYLGQEPKIQRPAHKLPESFVTLREVQPKFSSKNMGMISGGLLFCMSSLPHPMDILFPVALVLFSCNYTHWKAITHA